MPNCWGGTARFLSGLIAFVVVCSSCGESSTGAESPSVVAVDPVDTTSIAEDPPAAAPATSSEADTLPSPEESPTPEESGPTIIEVTSLDPQLPESITPLLVIAEGGGPTDDNCPAALAPYQDQEVALAPPPQAPIASTFEFCTKGLPGDLALVQVSALETGEIIHESEAEIYSGRLVWGQRGDELLFAKPGVHLVSVSVSGQVFETQLEVVLSASPQVVYLGRDVWTGETRAELINQLRIVGLDPGVASDVLVFDYFSEGDKSRFAGSVEVVADQAGSVTIALDETEFSGRCWAIVPLASYLERAMAGETADFRYLELLEEQQRLDRPVACL